MCDGFPAISAEQLTKAVNLAAAGILSPLDTTEEEESSDTKQDSIGNKITFENDVPKDIPAAVSKSSLQLLENLSVSISPQLSRICNGGIATPSTSFYGRARKVSTKKKTPEDSASAASNGKKYSSRKNYKLAPPLITNGVRGAVQNLGPKILLDPQIVKLGNSNNHFSNVRPETTGKNQAVGIRPITIIQSSHFPKKVAKESSSCTPISSPSSFQLSNESTLLSPTIYTKSSSPNQALHNSPSSYCDPATISSGFNQGDQPMIVTKPGTAIPNEKMKNATFIPLKKPDPVFRIPFPVTFSPSSLSASGQATPVNNIKIVRLPVNFNTSHLNVSNILNSNPPFSIISSSQVLGQVPIPKEKLQSQSAGIAATLPSHHLPVTKTTTSSVVSTQQAVMIPRQTTAASQIEALASLPSQNGTAAAETEVSAMTAAAPKILLASATQSTVNTANILGKRQAVDTLSAISLPNTALTSLSALSCHIPSQKIVKTIKPFTPNLSSSKSSQAPTQSTSRYVSIRPSLNFVTNGKTPALLSSPNSRLRPVFIVTSNPNLPHPIVTPPKKEEPHSDVANNSVGNNIPSVSSGSVSNFPSAVSPSKVSSDRISLSPTTTATLRMCPSESGIHSAVVKHDLIGSICAASPIEATLSPMKETSSSSSSNAMESSASNFPSPGFSQPSLDIRHSHQSSASAMNLPTTTCHIQTSPTVPPNSSDKLKLSGLSPFQTGTAIQSVATCALTSSSLSSSSSSSSFSSLSPTAPFSSQNEINAPSSSSSSSSQPILTVSSLDSINGFDKSTAATAAASALVSPVLPRGGTMTVIKDSFSSKGNAQQGSVRLTVYPLPQGFKPTPSTRMIRHPTSFTAITGQASSSTIAASQPQTIWTTNPSRDSFVSVTEGGKNSTPPQQCLSISSTVTATADKNSANLAAASSGLSEILRSPSSVAASLGPGGTDKQQKSSSVESVGQTLTNTTTNTTSPGLSISPAGILQLQSLLRQMGTSEGYFIISTPRRSQPTGKAPQTLAPSPKPSPLSPHKVGMRTTSMISTTCTATATAAMLSSSTASSSPSPSVTGCVLDSSSLTVPNSAIPHTKFSPHLVVSAHAPVASSAKCPPRLSPSSVGSCVTSESREIFSPKSSEVFSPKSSEMFSLKSNEIFSPKTNAIFSPKSSEIFFPKSNEMFSSKSNEIFSSKSNEIFSPKTNAIFSSESNEISSPKTNEIFSSKSNEISSPKTNEIIFSSKSNEIFSPKTNEIFSSKSNETISSTITSSFPSKYRQLCDPVTDICVENNFEKSGANLSLERINDVEMEGRGEEDMDEEDSLSSTDSSCSSNALVIETNEQAAEALDERLTSLNESIESSSPNDASRNVSRQQAACLSNNNDHRNKETTEDMMNENSVGPSAVGSLDTNLSSPLSLGEMVRQQYYRNGTEYQSLYSPPFASYKELIVSSPEKFIMKHLIKGDGNSNNATGASNENSDIRFPIPESPLFSSLSRHLQQQHQPHPTSQNENHQALLDHVLNTPHTLYTHHDHGINDIHMHNSSDIEAAMNLQRLSECPPAPQPLPPPPSSSSSLSSSSIHPDNGNAASNCGNGVIVGSPKSPLSVNSSSHHQILEAHAPLHPPMTPNTVLINLLNRVPTPLLTNHQDLLVVPSSQENEIHFEATTNQQQALESSGGKRLQAIHEKSIDNDGGTKEAADSCRDVLYNPSSHSVVGVGDTEAFRHPQNALDLIASNYLPPARKGIANSMEDQMPVFSNSQQHASAQNLTSFSRSWQQESFTQCGNNTLTYSSPGYSLSQFNGHEMRNDLNHQSTAGKPDCGRLCKSCSVPITITVNLDSDTVSLSSNNNMADLTESGNQAVAEQQQHHQLDQSFHNLQHELPQQQQQQQCVLFDGFTSTNSVNQEKASCDAEIIRHLIMNTGNNSNQHLFTEASSILHFDTCDQTAENCHFEPRPQDAFLPTNEGTANIHSSVSGSNGSQFGSTSFDQRISMSQSLSQETCHETFNNLNNSDTLVYDNNSSYENVQMNVAETMDDCSFDCNSSTTMSTYRTSSNSVFDSTHNAIFSNPQNSNNTSYILPNSLSDIQTSFDTAEHHDKDQMTLHESHIIQPDGKLIQSSEYTSHIAHNDLFFHQSTASESHSTDLHLYDMSSLHNSSQELGYPMPEMENHTNQLKSHQDLLQSSHVSDLQAAGLLGANQCDLQVVQATRGKQLQDHPFDFSIDQSHQFASEPMVVQGGSESTAPFSSHQANLAYLNEPFSSQFYRNAADSSLPIFTQQCAVGSEAPLMDSNNPTLHCPLPSASGMQLEFTYQPQDAPEVGEKHPVLPSASFSPPSVADPAVTPDPGAMDMYNGSFHNLSAYDSYLRGGHSESRAQIGEPVPESGKFCVECNTMYKNQCKFHPCDCRDVVDTPILSHARLTLPTCLKLGPSAVVGHTNNTGVFAKERIAVRTKFGPLIGSPVSCDQLGSTRSFSLWQTFAGSNVKVMDTSDENTSNWLMFVKPARVSSEQNLVAFQHGNRVFFVTRTEVKGGEELLYWFSKDYARMLGISSKPKNAQHQLCPHCPVCKLVFADRKQVRSHIRIQHPKPQVNKCTRCSRSFSKVSHLNAHVLAVHLQVKKFACDHCGKRFGDSSNLRKHVKSHSDERQYKCQICSKDFRQKAHLQVHMNSHMPVKHEQCRFCGNRFTRAFERKQHELQHTKQNRIECQHCSKVFYKQKIYKEHLKIHRNERNFPCNHCGKAFRNKFALTRHGPACKQRKRTLSLIPAETRTNILARHSLTSSSSSSLTNGLTSADFSNGQEDDSTLNSSSVSSTTLLGVGS